MGGDENNTIDYSAPGGGEAAFPLSTDDGRRFLRIVAGAFLIQRHYQLFRWLSGEIQEFLPHQVLISAWGDFAKWELSLDVVSAMPGTRTHEVARFPIDAMLRHCHAQWIAGGRQGNFHEVRLRALKEVGPSVFFSLLVIAVAFMQMTIFEVAWYLRGMDNLMIDMKTEQNLTEERLRKLNAIPFASLPLNLAVKIRRGDGKRVLAMFADPYCPACKRFEQELAQVNDVSIYVFMLPIIHPELADDSRAIWCSPDRAKAWVDLALDGRRPKAKPTCATPLKEIAELADKLGIRATPTLFLADGERIDGGLSAKQLDAALNAAQEHAKQK